MEQVTLGLSKIEMGDIAADGGPAADADLEQVGTELAGSTTYDTADGTEVNVNSDVQDDPLFSVTRRGATTFNWEIASYDPDTQKAYMGGTVVTDDETSKKTWQEPDNQVVQEKTIRITSEFGLVATITRASVTAKMTGKFSRDGQEVMRIAVTAKVLKPTKAGAPRVAWTEQ